MTNTKILVFIREMYHKFYLYFVNIVSVMNKFNSIKQYLYITAVLAILLFCSYNNQQILVIILLEMKVLHF